MLIGNATERQEQLPSEANDFIGRTAELRRVQALLRDNRLVTLVGPGRCGQDAGSAPHRRPGRGGVPGRGLGDPALRAARPRAAAAHRGQPPGTAGAVRGLAARRGPHPPARPQPAADPGHLRAHHRRGRDLRRGHHHRGALGHGARHQPRAARRDRRELLHPARARPAERRLARSGSDRRDRAVRAARGRRRPRLRGHRGEPRRRGPALHAARRHAAGDRTGRRPAAGAAAQGAGRPARPADRPRAGAADRRAARTATAAMAVTGRCATPSAGATTCAPRPSRRCGPGCRSSPGASASTRSRRCAPAAS